MLTLSTRQFCSAISLLFFHFSWTLLSLADKNPRAPPILAYYPTQPTVQLQAGYPRKDACPPPDPRVPISADGTVTDPNENFGRPFYPCIYNFTELEGEFFLVNGTYIPCVEPRVLDVLRVGETLPEGVTVRKGVHQSIAVKFPSGPESSIPLVAALVTEGLVVVTNTSTPVDGPRNLGFHRAFRKKIALRKRDSTPYSRAQVDVAKALYVTLTSIVDSAERHLVAINREQEFRKSLGPFIVASLQTFATPSTRALESVESLHPDYVLAEQTFGLGGSRFEFERPVDTSQKIAELLRSSPVPMVDLGQLGANPAQSSRNTLLTFNNVVELSRVAQREMSLALSRETEQINANSVFNFTYATPLTSAYCNRPIEIDPRGHLHGGTVLTTIGMGMVT